MKIFFLVNSSVFFKSHFLNLARSLSNKGWDVYIGAGDDKEKELFIELGFTFILLSLSRKSINPFSEINTIKNIYESIKCVRPDVLHMFTIKPIIYGCLVNKLFLRKRVPLSVASITGLGSAFLATNTLGKLLWLMIKQAYKFVLSVPTTNVIFENCDDKRVFVETGIVPEKRAFIVNGAGVNISIFSPLTDKPTEVSVVLVARLLKDKGIREYIDAGRILKEQGVNIILKLVGSIDNDNISTMKQVDIDYAHRLGYVEYLGQRSDIDNIYKKSHIACLPSYREGLPKSLIEAMACGLPIITTDVPGCRQMIHNGRSGIIVPVKDSSSLALAIKNLALDTVTRQSMGRESRIIAEKIYSHESIFTSFYEIYHVALVSENE